MYKSLGALVARSLAISSSKFALVKLFKLNTPLSPPVASGMVSSGSSIVSHPEKASHLPPFPPGDDQTPPRNRVCRRCKLRTVSYPSPLCPHIVCDYLLPHLQDVEEEHYYDLVKGRRQHPSSAAYGSQRRRVRFSAVPASPRRGQRGA
jgi:hypothetical protein